MKPFEPNLDPEPAEEWELLVDANEKQRIDEMLDDTMRDYCGNCGGRGYTIEFGHRRPCTKGMKILRRHPPRVVCYHAGQEPDS